VVGVSDAEAKEEEGTKGRGDDAGGQGRERVEHAKAAGRAGAMQVVPVIVGGERVVSVSVTEGVRMVSCARAVAAAAAAAASKQEGRQEVMICLP